MMPIIDQELLSLIDKMRAVMISVATGGPRIDQVNHEFQNDYREVAAALVARGIDNPIAYSDLWQWHGRWSQDDLPTYASRRVFVGAMFDPLINLIRNGRSAPLEPTGWTLVDRQMSEAVARLSQARTEEQYQAVGLFCREVLISLAQEVFDPARHPTDPDVRVSITDFKRMIEAYISVELRGSAADEARRHARTALDLALRLQHLRTANFRDAAICVEATGAVVSIIAIVSGRRDPQPILEWKP
ncbi:hypothetical protein NKJ59_11045 [Mesorhizobium australicum]|uniref:hypothetical protein n=1 Tax=Mesorhizobium australicum TaxID=536018 RepID=UPI00333A6F23